MINKVILVGNAGKDPEVRTINSDVKTASLSLATTERFRDKDGNVQENTQWHNVVAFRGAAAVMESYVKKGSLLYIEGSLRYRDWTGQDGQKHSVTEIVAETVKLLDKKA